MHYFKKFGLFWLGVILTAIAAVLTFTPLHWYLMGRPDETYPELFWGFVGMPVALIVLIAGFVWAVFYKPRSSN